MAQMRKSGPAKPVYKTKNPAVKKAASKKITPSSVVKGVGKVFLDPSSFIVKPKKK